MSPDPATLLERASRFRSDALASRGTRGNPAYLPVDVDLLTKLIDQAFDAWPGECLDGARFYAENILGLHIDNPPGKE